MGAEVIVTYRVASGQVTTSELGRCVCRAGREKGRGLAPLFRFVDDATRGRRCEPIPLATLARRHRLSPG